MARSITGGNTGSERRKPQKFAPRTARCPQGPSEPKLHTHRRPVNLRRVIAINAGLTLFTWTAFLLVLGPRYVAENFVAHLDIAITMVPGSMVGGGTSEGGGAVAFPILTKVLGIDPFTARLFTFAVQSVGMSAAAISIFATRTPIERRVLLWAAPGAVMAAVVSTLTIAPVISGPTVRVAFTALVTSLAIALIAQVRSGSVAIWDRVPLWGPREKITISAAGVLGGAISGLAGVGVDTIVFIVIVLLMRVSEAVATPTTVVLMAIVSVACFAATLLGTETFEGDVVHMWQAAALVVVLGAPMGAWLCRYMRANHIRKLLLMLISLELISTLLLVPFTPALLVFAIASLSILALACITFTRLSTYTQSQ